MNAPSLFQHVIAPFGLQHFSYTPSFGILGTYSPTACGLATFSAALTNGLTAKGATVSVVRIADGDVSGAPNVAGELVNGSASSIAATSELLNQSDVAVIQHEYGIYGGRDGDEVVQIMTGLRVPSIVVVHTVLKRSHPTPTFGARISDGIGRPSDRDVGGGPPAPVRGLRRRPPQGHRHPARRRAAERQ